MTSYRYIGAILPEIPSSGFVTSVFVDDQTNKYYVQEEGEGDCTARFVEIRASENQELFQMQSLTNVVIRVKVGSPYIYSYVVEKGSTFYGSRSEIEKDLLTLINSTNLNVHSQLLLSAFLKLDGKISQLVEDSNKDLENSGISNRIDENMFFISASHAETSDISYIEQIIRKYEICKQ
jgi:hypothetical protein